MSTIIIVTVNPELLHHHYFYLHNTAIILHMVSVLQRVERLSYLPPAAPATGPVSSVSLDRSGSGGTAKETCHCMRFVVICN